MERTKLSMVVKALRKEYGLTQPCDEVWGRFMLCSQFGTRKANTKDG